MGYIWRYELINWSDDDETLSFGGYNLHSQFYYKCFLLYKENFVPMKIDFITVKMLADKNGHKKYLIIHPQNERFLRKTSSLDLEHVQFFDDNFLYDLFEILYKNLKNPSDDEIRRIFGIRENTEEFKKELDKNIIHNTEKPEINIWNWKFTPFLIAEAHVFLEPIIKKLTNLLIRISKKYAHLSPLDKRHHDYMHNIKITPQELKKLKNKPNTLIDLKNFMLIEVEEGEKLPFDPYRVFGYYLTKALQEKIQKTLENKTITIYFPNNKILGRLKKTSEKSYTALNVAVYDRYIKTCSILNTIKRKFADRDIIDTKYAFLHSVTVYHAAVVLGHIVSVLKEREGMNREEQTSPT
jgi:hypothetical protein